MIDLKPCPFCGGKAIVRESLFLAYVRCKDCGVCTESYGTAEEAAETWNRRVNKVRPVRHGRWTNKRTIEHDGEWYCSNCNKEITIYMGPKRSDRYRYCPNCGARMEEEE